jgi:hypothetical protein
MAQKIKLEDKEYDVDSLSEGARAKLASLQFTTQKIQELTNMQALLQRAKNSYIETLKREMLSSKAGFLLQDD